VVVRDASQTPIPAVLRAKGRQVVLVLATHLIALPSCLGTGAPPNHPSAAGLHVAVVFDGPAGPIGEGSQVVIGHIPTVLPPSTS